MFVDDFGNVYVDNECESNGPTTSAKSNNKGYSQEKIQSLWNKSWKAKFPNFEMKFDDKPQLRCKTCAKMGRITYLGSWTDVESNHPTRQMKRHLGQTNEPKYPGNYHCVSVSSYRASQVQNAEIEQNVERWKQYNENARLQ